MKRRAKKKKVQSAALAPDRTVGKPILTPGEKTADNEPENPFDFGGLPSRDLKKNLGCG